MMSCQNCKFSHECMAHSRLAHYMSARQSVFTVVGWQLNTFDRDVGVPSVNHQTLAGTQHGTKDVHYAKLDI